MKYSDFLKYNTFLVISILTILSASVLAEGDSSKGREVYDKLCAQCHGPEGLGDGPLGKSLPPTSKPGDLQKAVFKFATDDTKFTELIKKGGGAVGLNPLMPPQAALSDDDIKNVIAFVHSLKK